MIVVVTPNPALDVTHTVDRLTVGAVHRVTDVAVRAGGKGLNVARTLRALGEAVTVTGLLPRESGERLRALLAEPGLTQDWVEVPGEVRRTVTVVSDAGATGLYEAGTPVGPTAWAELVERVRTGPGDVVVVSGSMPSGSRPEDLATLVRRARGSGARCLVDTSGPALSAAARAGADALKPNAEELVAATGEANPAAGARALLAAGAGAVVVSRGPDGLLLVTPGLERSVRPVADLRGNPTGAGDAAVAALARALARAGTRPVAEVLAAALPDAVALSGATVLSPVAGEVDPDVFARMRAELGE